jgi:hypothetical protein
LTALLTGANALSICSASETLPVDAETFSNAATIE